MYEGKSILQLHELLVSKKVTPVDLAKDAIELAKKDNNNAFEYIIESEAIEIASNLGEPEANNPLWLSSWRREPAAAFLGFAKSALPLIS